MTTAKDRDLAEDTIMRHTRHKSVTIMRRYDRRAGLWVDNAALLVGVPPSAERPSYPKDSVKVTEVEAGRPSLPADTLHPGGSHGAQ